MSNIGPESANEKVLGHFSITHEESERRIHKGAQTLGRPDLDSIALQLRELMNRGIAHERLGWCEFKTHPQAKPQFFITVRD
jgi:hypothetical protein